MGMGLGLMSGSNPQDAWGNALAGMQRGTLVDNQSAKQKREMEREKALSEAGSKLFPQYSDIIKANPTLASSLIEKQVARDTTPDNGQIIGTGDAGYYRVFRDGRKEQLLPPTGGQTQQYDQLVETRKRQAQSLGLKEGDMAYQSFVLTGKMPREDAQPLTATDRKAILEADEGVLAAETAHDIRSTLQHRTAGAVGIGVARAAHERPARVVERAQAELAFADALVGGGERVCFGQGGEGADGFQKAWNYI